MRRLAIAAGAVALLTAGCASEDIPQAYRGRMFGRTGAFAFYTGKTGFYGPVLGPGTYFTGTYDEIHKVDCSTLTVREDLNALTRDGVQFGLNIYVRFSADCSDAGVQAILTNLPTDADRNVTAMRIYQTYVQPAVGAAVREVISPIRANDINNQREQILSNIRKRFLEIVANREKNITRVYEVNLSNLDFPEDMDRANTSRAVQSILRDKAIAERERVTAEIQTMAMRRDLAEKEGEAQAVRIQRVGEALQKYPLFLQYDLQSRMPEIYEKAGQQGNLVITAPNPSIVAAPRHAVGAPGVPQVVVPPSRPPAPNPADR